MYGKELGEMGWMDLSVPDAEIVSQFYQRVLGWSKEATAMKLGDESYNDFVMTSSVEENIITGMSTAKKCEEKPSPTHSQLVEPQSLVTGICHAKGENQDMPAVWLPYFLVENIDDSASKVIENGGCLITKVKQVGADRYVVIKDPAGAMAAIYQKSQ